MFQSPRKIALVYAVFGAVFGLMWGFGVYLPDAGFVGFIFFGGGILLLISLALCTWYLTHIGFIALDASRTRLAASALIVIAAYPVSLSSSAVPSWFESLLRRTHYWFFYAKHLESITEHYSLCFCALTASLMIWVALSIVLKQWNKKPLAQLVVAGIVAAALFSGIESSRIGSQFELAMDTRGWSAWFIEISILFAVGQSLFAAICGYAIAQRAQPPHAFKAKQGN